MACPGCALLERLRIDDPVGCVPTHAVAGVWGLLAVAFFAEKDILKDEPSADDYGIFKGGPWRFLGVQLLLTVAVAAWAAITTFLELLLIDKLVGMRMSLEDELVGADKVEHGIEYGVPVTPYIRDKVYGQTHSNGNGVEHISFEADEEIERPKTAPSVDVDPVERDLVDVVSYKLTSQAWQ